MAIPMYRHLLGAGGHDERWRKAHSLPRKLRGVQE